MRIPGFFEDGSPLYVDASYLQFLARIPIALENEAMILVGRPKDFENVFQKYGATGLSKDYFARLEPDSNLPSFLDR